MENREIFSQRLKKLRSNLKKTQKQFAELVNSTPATISAYENSTKNPSLDVVMNIAKRCGVSVDWLCGLSNKESYVEVYSSYADVLKTLLEIEKALPFIILDSCDAGKLIYGTRKGISFLSDNMDGFLTELKKYKDLLSAGSIDNDIYQACIEKLLRDSSGFINDANGELPFQQ